MNKAKNPILSILGRIIQGLMLFILTFGIFCVIIGSMLGISMVKVAQNAPKINPESIMLTLNENSRILDRDGNLIEAIAFDEFREIVKYKDIPKPLINAFISLEDERFESHQGVSLRSMIRSMLENVSAGGIVQGGSTITQQLVKNVYLTNDVSYDRKIKEMYLALKLEQVLSKEQIMEAYLNRIFLGQNSYGVEAAAKTYFSKSVGELNIAQFATLASIVQSPSHFALFKSYTPSTVPKGAEVVGDYFSGGIKRVAVKNDAVMNRKNNTLKKMYELEKITKEQYEEALKFDVMATIEPGSKRVKEMPSQISYLVKDDAIKTIMKSKNIDYEEARNMLYTGGLDIYTTIDWDAQKKLEETVDDFASIFRRYNRNGVILAKLRRDRYGDIISNTGAKIYYKKSNLLTRSNNLYLPKGYFEITEDNDLIINSARFAHVKSGIYVKPYYIINDKNELVTYRVSVIDIPLQYITELDNGGFKISAEYFKNIKDFYHIDDDGDLVINNSYYTLETEGTVQPQTSSTVLDSKTGEIVAIVGNRGNSVDDTINRATDYPRPPSSTMKPLAAYAPSVELGRRLSDPVDDTPNSMVNGKPWPKNVYNFYRGVVTTRYALSESMNPPAVKILNEVGIDKSKEFLTKFGIINAENPEKDNFVSKEENKETNDENLSLALGGITKGLTTKELASAYQTFANEGERIPSSIISKITKNGETIYENKHEAIRVISKETNFLIRDVLVDVTKLNYLRRYFGNRHIDMAGKTGTSNNNNDYWFAGFNNYYTAATWIGFDDARIEMLGNSSVAVELFNRYMNKLLEGKEASKFNRPDGIVTARVSKVDGLLPNELTSSDPRGNMVYTEYFKSGTVPNKQSDANVLLKVDKRNDLLASDTTPAFQIVEKHFVKRVLNYNPSSFNGVLPMDWNFQPPTKYSDLGGEDQTTTEVKDDGTIIETTYKVNGDIVVKEIKPDGTIIEQTTKPNGQVTTRVILPGDQETNNEPNPRDTNRETNNEPNPRPNRSNRNNRSNRTNRTN